MTLTREQVQALKLSRHTVTTPDTTSQLAGALLQAWDEVEKLRETLKQITEVDGMTYEDDWQDMKDIARQALEVRE